MGISGLLPLLRETQEKGHIEQFAGQTVGIDSYIWLYRGAFSCAADLALGKPTTKYIAHFMSRAKMLRHYNVEPLFVFDGGLLPSKECTELERQRNRKERREKGMKLWGQSKKKAAFDLFQRSLEVTPQMVRCVVDELKKHGFKYVVAPYEADAQLAYLESQGVISAAVSEDSDLIVFGCQKIILKMDQYGDAVMFDRSKMDAVTAVDVKGWDKDRIRGMCILSGCDYLPSVPGIGLKKAHRYMARSTDLAMAVRLMRNEGCKVPDGYKKEVRRAELTFLYQRVFDPRSRTMVHVTKVDESTPPLDEMPFIGKLLEPAIVRDIADCLIDPISLDRFAQGAKSLSSPMAPTAGSTSAHFESLSTSEKPRPGTLVSFWANPKVQMTPTTPATASAAGCELEVQVKFRGKTADNSLAVRTQTHSKFFGKKTEPATVEPPAAGSETVDLTKDETAEFVQPETPKAKAIDEECSQTLTIIAETADTPQTLLPAESQATEVESASQEMDAGCLASSLFAKFGYREAKVPNHAVTPRYRQGNGRLLKPKRRRKV
ncbi:PIN domain-like protein [Linderina pennispora]|uniref:PIN domain-like protein n=1 Tax=Linderina pennispora TaxID=61395 RepID=A0A1Y1WA49_9FUNG|nr:PIN domain-like protein [Linderina pennispora]ORX70255.1 PIN domain-like protein [Linderina pennispora]